MGGFLEIVGYYVLDFAKSLDFPVLFISSQDRAYNQSLIDRYDYSSVPQGRSYDLLYIKLGYQICMNFRYPNRNDRNLNNLYSPS
jgi:hypothetical protein